MKDRYGDVSAVLDGHVACLEIRRPPHNFFDHELIRSIADALEDIDAAKDARCVLLTAEGKSFCAGANFSDGSGDRNGRPAQVDANPLYTEAVRIFACKTPVVAAVQGAAIGGGLGLALTADFRVVSPKTRFAANFVKLGIHPGFGLTFTLPRLIGQQKASLMFYTGRRIDGPTAVAWGLADLIAEPDALRGTAFSLAAEIAEGAPLALRSTRATMRYGLAEAVKAQTDHEFAEQSWLFQTEDHAEGVRAVSERRSGQFKGR